MSARVLTLVLVLHALLGAREARATTSSCDNVGDGTPCTGVCVELGTCMSNVCVAGTLRPDGSPCSTENVCTIGDHCTTGTCVPGIPRTCPDKSSCEVGVCRPHIGCGWKDLCLPDLASADLSERPDLGPPIDLAGVDLFGSDLCVIPIGSEFFLCEAPDGGFVPGDDASVDPGLDGGLGFHVRGSRVGDCAYGGDSARDSLGIALLLLALAALAWRARTR